MLLFLFLKKIEIYTSLSFSGRTRSIDFKILIAVIVGTLLYLSGIIIFQFYIKKWNVKILCNKNSSKVYKDALVTDTSTVDK